MVLAVVVAVVARVAEVVVVVCPAGWVPGAAVVVVVAPTTVVVVPLPPVSGTVVDAVAAPVAGAVPAWTALAAIVQSALGLARDLQLHGSGCGRHVEDHAAGSGLTGCQGAERRVGGTVVDVVLGRALADVGQLVRVDELRVGVDRRELAPGTPSGCARSRRLPRACGRAGAPIEPMDDRRRRQHLVQGHGSVHGAQRGSHLAHRGRGRAGRGEQGQSHQHGRGPQCRRRVRLVG